MYKVKCNGIITVIAIVALVFIITACGEKADNPIPEGQFKAEISIDKNSLTIPVKKMSAINVSLINKSPALWPAKGKYPVKLSYHILDKKGKMITWDGMRTDLLKDLDAGESVQLNAKIKGPEKAGEYVIDFDIVQETVGWFSLKKTFKAVRLDLKAE
jgi:hypothetical protein